MGNNATITIIIKRQSMEMPSAVLIAVLGIMFWIGLVILGIFYEEKDLEKIMYYLQL